ncbi:hypothetical protein [Massilia sp. ZL223]|uniref:hypothetical protein n=1 Tax=Massilia sp. ZL223 TaxID=2824904 RepID=UPI001B83F5D9|nr:hypothetical protein [Massilia sp. ZL223]MBQ5963160.1 hypothetical protein [Massilia sp. ZL223]
MGSTICFAAVFLALELFRRAGQRWKLTNGRAAALGWLVGMILLALTLETPP